MQGSVSGPDIGLQEGGQLLQSQTRELLARVRDSGDRVAGLGDGADVFSALQASVSLELFRQRVVLCCQCLSDQSRFRKPTL